MIAGVLHDTDPDPEVTVRQVLNTGMLVFVRRLDFDLASNPLVVAGGVFRQSVTPRFQRHLDMFTGERMVWFRESSYRVFDQGIGEVRAKRLNDLVPRLPVECGQELAVQLPAARGQAGNARIGPPKLDDPRKNRADQHHGNAAVVDERLVAILGDREPGVAVAIGKARPSPLPGVTVLIADEKVHQPGLEEGPGVDALTGAVLEGLQHALGAADPPRAQEPRSIVRALGGMHLQRPYQAGIRVSVPPEPGVVRNHHEAVLRMEDARRLHERVNHQCTGGQQRTYKIVHHVGRERVLDIIGQPSGGVLVEGANRVPDAVLSGKVEGHGLSHSAGSKRRQATSDAVEVENRHLDARGPEVPVVLSVEPPAEWGGTKPFAGNHQVGSGTRRRNRSVESGAGRQRILLGRDHDRNRQREQR